MSTQPTGPEDSTSYMDGFLEGFTTSESRYLKEIQDLIAERLELLQALQSVIDVPAVLDESTVPLEGPDSDPDSVVYTLRASLTTLRRARGLTSDARRAGII